MNDSHADLLKRALAADPGAVRALVEIVLPVIRARATLALRRRAAAERRGRDPHQERDDLAQDVLGALFAEHGRVLRSWDPERGLSLKNYVGLVAARQIASILRSGRRSPWSEEPAPDSELAGLAETAPPPDIAIGARQLFDRIVERLEEELSVRGMALFRALVFEEQSVPVVCGAFAMSEEAVYAWRSRLLRRARELAVELQAGSTLRSTGGGGARA